MNEALEEFRALIAAHPDYSPGLVALAQLLVDVQFTETTVDQSNHRRHHQAVSSNGLLVATSQLTEANDLLRRARDVDPESSQAALQSCWAGSLLCEEKSAGTDVGEKSDSLQRVRRCQLDAVKHCHEAVRLAFRNGDAQACFDAAATEAKILFSAGKALESLEKYGCLLTEPAQMLFASNESNSIRHVTAAAHPASMSTCARLMEPQTNKLSQSRPDSNVKVAVIPPQYSIQNCMQDRQTQCSVEDLTDQECASSQQGAVVKLFSSGLAACQPGGSSGHLGRSVLCDLRDLALALEQTARSRQVSNNGGWHSDAQQAAFLDLDNSAHSDRLLAAATAYATHKPTTTATATAVAQEWARGIAQVREWLTEQIARYLLAQVDTCCQARRQLTEGSSSCGTHCVCSLETCDLRMKQTMKSVVPSSVQLVEQLFRGIFFESSWVNVNRRAQTNARHSHGAVTVSGVFYIDSGFEDGDSANTTTCTPLRVQTPAFSIPDGHPCTTAWSSPETEHLLVGRREAVRDHDVAELVPVPGSGAAGTLALWPGYVDHDVQSHTGPRARISTAFNVWVLV